MGQALAALNFQIICMDNSILIHNIAGELASCHVCYLAKMNMGFGNSHVYFTKNWCAEYRSRVKQMTEKPELIKTLNGFNDFYKTDINQSATVKRTFMYEKYLDKIGRTV